MYVHILLIYAITWVSFMNESIILTVQIMYVNSCLMKAYKSTLLCLYTLNESYTGAGPGAGGVYTTFTDNKGEIKGAHLLGHIYTSPPPPPAKILSPAPFPKSWVHT